MGETVARRIEASLQLPAYWMNQKNEFLDELPKASACAPPPLLVGDVLWANRLQNYLRLAQHYGTDRKLAAHTGIRASPHPSMGEWVARRIELALGLPDYWMDNPDNDEVPELGQPQPYYPLHDVIYEEKDILYFVLPAKPPVELPELAIEPMSDSVNARARAILQAPPPGTASSTRSPRQRATYRTAPAAESAPLAFVIQSADSLLKR